MADINRINEILFGLAPEQKVEFLEKLFVRNKRTNRFSIS